MTQRDDPSYYEFDVSEVKTGETHRARMFCWWSGELSVNGLRAMCDCQLGGFFVAAAGNRFPTWEQFRIGTDSGNANNAFTHSQNDWLRKNKCDHSGPSRRYAVLRAITPDGSIIEIDSEMKAA